ncbi:MAG: PhnD/SsuA/transferrin family substrate-binding protein, partial [Gammaproteobacteria bacterium]
MEILRSDDNLFRNFGQVYLSTTYPGVVKAWHYHKLQDLKDTTIAMPPAKSANARMALRALYKKKLIPGRDVMIRYFNSHDSCIQQVWVGNASACASVPPPIQLFEKRMKAKLRSIYSTAPIPHVLFVVDPKVPEAQRHALQKLILNWDKNKTGRKILKNLEFPPFTVVKPGEYRIMHHYEPMSVMAKASAGDARDLVLGIFPYLSTRQLVKNFAPLLPALSHAVQMPIHLRTALDFGTFSDNLASGKYDIVLVQPFEVEKAVQLGYIPLAMMKNSSFGTFYVRKTSHFHRIQELKGHIIAMAPINSAESHLGRDALRKAGLIPGKDVKIRYLHTHDACLREVQRGGSAACATSPLVLKMLPAEYSTGLRSIGKTMKMPGVVFLAHKRLPEKLRDRLEKEIVSWRHTKSGRKILKSMNFGSFVPVD